MQKTGRIGQHTCRCGDQVRATHNLLVFHIKFLIGTRLSGKRVVSAGPNAAPVDLVMTLGGDGTILHAASLFSHGAVPPVLSFSMGTLGFLLPFREFFCLTFRHPPGASCE